MSTKLTRDQIAARVAQDIPEGAYVNLGIGLPTLVANHLPADREVILHTENGMLGMGPAPAKDAIDPWLINAGKQYVTLREGGSFCHHFDSFAMIRGGHLDLCVLGAFQVAENGDIANWATSENDTAPAELRRTKKKNGKVPSCTIAGSGLPSQPPIPKMENSRIASTRVVMVT